MWLIAGLVFGLIQLSLLMGAWKQAVHPPNRDVEALWLLGVQVATLCVMTAYSIFVTSELLQIGIYPNQPLDIAIMAIFGVTLLTVGGATAAVSSQIRWLDYGWPLVQK